MGDRQIANAPNTSLATIARIRQKLVEERFEAVLTRKHSSASVGRRMFGAAAEAKLIALARRAGGLSDRYASEHHLGACRNRLRRGHARRMAHPTRRSVAAQLLVGVLHREIRVALTILPPDPIPLALRRTAVRGTVNPFVPKHYHTSSVVVHTLTAKMSARQARKSAGLFRPQMPLLVALKCSREAADVCLPQNLDPDPSQAPEQAATNSDNQGFKPRTTQATTLTLIRHDLDSSGHVRESWLVKHQWRISATSRSDESVCYVHMGRLGRRLRA
jgi:hypothetical protein